MSRRKDNAQRVLTIHATCLALFVVSACPARVLAQVPEKPSRSNSSSRSIARRNDAPYRTPDVLIMVFSTGLPEDHVSLTYSQAVPHSTATADARRLAEVGGWELRALAIKTSAALRETSVTFQSPRVVVRRSQVLPLAPFIECFRRYDALRLAFVISGGFSLKEELKNPTGDGVKVGFHQQGSTYSFDLRILDHEAGRLAGKTRATMSSGDRRRKEAALFALTAVTCAVASLGLSLLVVLTVWHRRRWRRLGASTSELKRTRTANLIPRKH